MDEVGLEPKKSISEGYFCCGNVSGMWKHILMQYKGTSLTYVGESVSVIQLDVVK